MSINSQKQTYLQSVEWLKWFNKKYNRAEIQYSKPKSQQNHYK